MRLAVVPCALSLIWVLLAAPAAAQVPGLQNLLNRAGAAVSGASGLEAGTVRMTGEELLAALGRMRSGFARGRPPVLFTAEELSAAGPAAGSASSSLLGTLASAMSNPLAALSGAASTAVDRALDALSDEVSYLAISRLLDATLEDVAVMARIVVEVPDPARLGATARQRLLTLGGYIAALKASNLAIDTAEGSLEKAKASYREVIESRAQQVRLLGEGVFARQGLIVALSEESIRGTSLLSEEDRRYLARLEGRRFETLLDDPVALNIVFAYLRGRDPERFRDYSLKVAQMRGHYDAYVRATVGSASLVGFTAAFLKQSKRYAEQYRLPGAVELATLLTQALNEVSTTVPRVVRLKRASDDAVEGSFQLEAGGRVLQRGASAKSALAALDPGAAQQFRDLLLPATGGRGGLMFRLYGQAPETAAGILDDATSRPTRNHFGKTVLQSDAENFLFKNALLGLQALVRQKIAQEVLFERAGAPADALEQAIARLQGELDAGALKLDNSQLRSLMYAAAQQSVAASAIRVGEHVLRIENPGVAGIADFERLAQQSLSQATVREFTGEREGAR